MSPLRPGAQLGAEPRAGRLEAGPARLARDLPIICCRPSRDRGAIQVFQSITATTAPTTSKFQRGQRGDRSATRECRGEFVDGNEMSSNMIEVERLGGLAGGLLAERQRSRAARGLFVDLGAPSCVGSNPAMIGQLSATMMKHSASDIAPHLARCSGASRPPDGARLGRDRAFERSGRRPLGWCSRQCAYLTACTSLFASLTIVLLTLSCSVSGEWCPAATSSGPIRPGQARPDQTGPDPLTTEASPKLAAQMGRSGQERRLLQVFLAERLQPGLRGPLPQPEHYPDHDGHLAGPAAQCRLPHALLRRKEGSRWPLSGLGLHQADRHLW